MINNPVNAPAETSTARTQEINKFLLNNGLFIKTNPAISPDLTLDFKVLVNELQAEAEGIAQALKSATDGSSMPDLYHSIVWPRSSITLENTILYVVESKRSGDCALISAALRLPDFSGAAELDGSLTVIPLWWENLIILKNAVLAYDPQSTIFPRVDDHLRRTSLGIGARFTTLHWPAVAWTMKALTLPLTANQNSIPRELVYDVDALLTDRLQNVSFPFIGGSVPEGHQGQSVMGMTHASIVTLLKYGFHHNNIPWGFNADHQPIGGHFDTIETALVEGSLFASYITYDISPELMLHRIIDDPAELDAAFNRWVDPVLFGVVVKRLSYIGMNIPEAYVKKMVTYLMPAMKKIQQRDREYSRIRRSNFTSHTGREFIRELSIDELPGETSLATFAVCCALTEALGVKFDFIAPNFGFQKNIPFADNAVLQEKIRSFSACARLFDVSIGFHSGSGKSVENYTAIGAGTEGRFEIKTSGRYTYEMGVALAKSADPFDHALWADWYSFTKELAVTNAFSLQETQRKFARDFITATLLEEGVAIESVFDTPEVLKLTLDKLDRSPDHVFWFEYNFLFVLAAEGRIDRLGDHSADGYRQRARFYGISDEGRLLYAKRVALYILLLAESTGIAATETVEKARKRLEKFKVYRELLADIG